MIDKFTTMAEWAVLVWVAFLIFYPICKAIVTAIRKVV